MKKKTSRAESINEGLLSVNAKQLDKLCQQDRELTHLRITVKLLEQRCADLEKRLLEASKPTTPEAPAK